VCVFSDRIVVLNFLDTSHPLYSLGLRTIYVLYRQGAVDVGVSCSGRDLHFFHIPSRVHP
jgi:hypothetical protein